MGQVELQGLILPVEGCVDTDGNIDFGQVVELPAGTDVGVTGILSNLVLNRKDASVKTVNLRVVRLTEPIPVIPLCVDYFSQEFIPADYRVVNDEYIFHNRAKEAALARGDDNGRRAHAEKLCAISFALTRKFLYMYNLDHSFGGRNVLDLRLNPVIRV